MARYRKKRYYRNYSKGKWSTRLSNITGSQTVNAGNTFLVRYTLATNPAQNDGTISQKYTVKNVSCYMDLESNNAILVENLQAFIMFIPQGYLDNGGSNNDWASTPYKHPEWIMAYRFFGSAKLDINGTEDGNYYPALRLSSRLARKLDTGDRIMIIIYGENQATQSSVTLEYRGLIKMNTKAN